MLTKKIIWLMPFLLVSFVLIGGDTPCGATDLDTSLSGSVTFDNSGNTDSGIEAPPYGDYSSPDMWFTFTMSGGELPMYLIPGSMTNPAIAIYSGDCSNPKLIYNVIDHNCTDNNDANDKFPAILFDELNDGETYFIRVWAEDGTSNGTFSISFDISVNDKEFLLYADATAMSDGCIQLTDQQNGQHGCAWYEEEIDFSQPFTHTMSAYFGTKDGNGADGICLVYQINGSDYCGVTGSGIGAGNMDNSFIVEFDTWQNGFLNDPAEDHSSININGDMNHNASIDGPVNLGNIEDGVFYDIEFSWDPATDEYSVSFDGNVIMSGTYDIINDVFGGQTKAWWGYTASTGGSNNEQIICPDTPDPVILGTQEFVEDTICKGDEFYGYSETGFYIEYTAGSGDCDHQINISLLVIPEIEPVYIYDTICSDDYYTYEGDYYDAGEYDVYLTSVNGCDSLVVLTIDTFSVPVNILTPDTLNCKNNSIMLKAVIENGDYIISYKWEGPSGESSEETWEVDKPGTYTLNVDFETDDLLCYVSKEVEVGLDTSIVVLQDFKDFEFECGEVIDNVVFSIDSPKTNIGYKWYYNNVLFDSSYAITVNKEGTYFVTAFDSTTWCSSTDTFSITETGDIPVISVQNDTLTCDKTEVKIVLDNINGFDEYLWKLNGDSISNIESPVFNKPGNYELMVVNNYGCSNTTTFELFVDNKKPIVGFKDAIISCNTESIKLEEVSPKVINTTFEYIWEDPSGNKTTEKNILATQGGKYYLEVKNPKNGCSFNDTINVDYLGKSPVISLSIEELNCNNTGYNIGITVDSSNVNYTWEYENNFFSDKKSPHIENPGNYKIIVTSAKGCETIENFEIESNTDTIPIEIIQPPILTCDVLSVILNTTVSTDVYFQWTGPNDFISDEKNPVVFESGRYDVSIINKDNGCPSSTFVIVKSDGSLPVFELQGDTLDCTKRSAEIRILTNDTYKDIEWVGPDYFSSSENNKIVVTKPGTYTVKVINELGCEKSLGFEIIDTSLIPEIKLETDDTIFYKLGESYNVIAKITKDEQNVNSIHWSPAKFLSCNDCLNPEFVSEVEENIDYTVTIKNIQGCDNTATLHARFIREKEKVVIDAPNIIIGDGQGRENSLFTIYGTPEELIDKIKTLFVFNRWGELVYENHDMPINDYSMGWDGTFKNEDVNPGVYVYYGEVLLLSGEIVKIYGDVTVVK